MSAWSFYLLDTGILSGATYSGPDKYLQSNTPAGCGAVAGLHDHERRRVDLVTGKVVAYIPPAPADTALQTWCWHAATERWVPEPTLAAIAQDVRAERGRRMAAADWVTLRAMRTGEPIPPEWAAYLQALADVPAQAGFPASINWPWPPA